MVEKGQESHESVFLLPLPTSDEMSVSPSIDSLPEDNLRHNQSSSLSGVSTSDFLKVVAQVRLAISFGIEPKLIAQGSSGSYFCKNTEGTIVGVFKPKNEEPYGVLNPKWAKWIHRNLFPCCFGRNCIVPNLGYISEAAASFVDRQLGLGIVPRTEIVLLASPSFHYSARQRWNHYLFGIPLPPKIGSFQLFLEGYQDSTSFFKNGYTSARNRSLNWTHVNQQEFQAGFERLVILDYLIRNTDRGSDNWMVKHSLISSDGNLGSSSTDTLNNITSMVSVAGIDHGLAFPTKHPIRVRSYPYGWLLNPIATREFSKETIQLVLPTLSSPFKWHELISGIETLFKIDSDFSAATYKLQKSVLQGQRYNLVETLQNSSSFPESPVTLCARKLVIVHEDDGSSRGIIGKIGDRMEILAGSAVFTSC